MRGPALLATNVFIAMWFWMTAVFALLDGRTNGASLLAFIGTAAALNALEAIENSLRRRR